jgi:ABC-type antimicrobial peptide transport system permease subunit
MVGRITTMSSLLAVVALIIAAVGLINTVTLTVTERAALRRLLRAVGLTPGNQAAVLGGELVALSLPSAAVGAVGGGLAGSYVASVVTGASHSRVLTVTHLDLPVVAAVVGAMVVGAVLCGLVVLWLPRVGLHD